MSWTHVGLELYRVPSGLQRHAQIRGGSDIYPLGIFLMQRYGRPRPPPLLVHPLLCPHESGNRLQCTPTDVVENKTEGNGQSHKSPGQDARGGVKGPT